MVDKNGIDERRPHTDEEWTRVRDSAVMLAESGNLLMMAPRAYDGGDWMKWSRRLVDISNVALEATQRKDADRIFEIGGDIDHVCEQCHREYGYADSPRRKR